MSVLKPKMESKNSIEEKNEDFDKLFNDKSVVKVKEPVQEESTALLDPEVYKVCDDEFEKSHNYLIYILISLFSLIVVTLSVIICYNIFYKKIFSNMYIAGIEISNMTKEEAVQKIEQTLEPNLNREITLKYEDYEYRLTPQDIEAKYNAEQVVDEAYRVGRVDNIFTNNIKMLKSFFAKTNFDIELQYSSEKLSEIMDKVNSNFSPLIQSSYDIQDEKIIIKKGTTGTEIKQDVLKEKIIDNITKMGDNVIEFGVIVREPNAINIDELHIEVYQAPVDAYYTKNPFEIHEAKDGKDFAITIDEAKSLLEKDEDEYIIPLKVVKPNITTDQIGTEAFPDLLATCTSPYIASKVGRTTNLKLASNKINGYVLMPGDTFSYNKVVGKRTVEAGFQLAGVYSGGEVVDGLGGGICQISSTLYNIVVMSNLDIVERENHTFLPGYLPAGRDATVVYGAIDFKFKNTREYPIKILSTVSGGYVTMKLYGLKVENEPTITFETVYHQTLYPQTIYKDTTDLPAGQTKVQSSGQNGCKSTTYKVVKQNGQVISRTVLSSDTYKAMNKIVLRGVTPKVVEQPVQSEPAPQTNQTTSAVQTTETEQP